MRLLNLIPNKRLITLVVALTLALITSIMVYMNRQALFPISTTTEKQEPTSSTGTQLSTKIPHQSKPSLDLAGELPPIEEWSVIELGSYKVKCPGQVKPINVPIPEGKASTQIKSMALYECSFNNHVVLLRIASYQEGTTVAAKPMADLYASHIKALSDTASFHHTIEIRAFNGHHGRFLSGTRKIKTSDTIDHYFSFYMTENHRQLFQFLYVTREPHSAALEIVLSTLSK